jgi:hypothetical protein
MITFGYYWLGVVWLKWRWKWPKLGFGTTKWKVTTSWSPFLGYSLSIVWLECSNENDQDWDLKQQNEK